MSLTARAPEFASDLQLIETLIEASSPKSPHRFDFPWRLSNPGMWSGRDARLWFDESGVPVACAAWQQPWAALDFSIQPGGSAREAEDAIFDWAAGHFRTLDAERGRPLPYWVEAREDDDELLTLFARHSYVLKDDYDYVLLRRDLDDRIPSPELPDGYTIRSLHGTSEVGAYAELHRRAFGSETMTAEWRAQSLLVPRYRPDLDLVVEAPDGRLAAFCVGWYAEAERTGQIEPVGTDPELQRLGIGRALIHEMLRRFAAAGAGVVLVETETTRTPARGIYEGVGFRPSSLVLRRGRRFL